MKNLLLCVSLAIGFSAGAQGRDIRFYAAEGVSLDGSEYHGTAYIEKTADHTCRIVWRIEQSDFEGVCMWYEGVLSVSFAAYGYVGMVIYKVNTDGSMQGAWTYADRDGLGTETLTPITGD